MRTLILNGARPGERAIDAVHEVLVDELVRAGHEVNSYILRDIQIAPCMGDFGCWTRTPGVCVIDDAARRITADLMRSDVYILLTPVTFGGYSSELKKLLDRVICIVLPVFQQIDGETHHEPRYSRYPALVGLGVLPSADRDAERIFATLVRRNAVNFHAPRHTTIVIHVDENQEALYAGMEKLHTSMEMAV